MASNTELSKKKEKKKWLDRIRENDPEKAALFCSDCTGYIGFRNVFQCDCD